MVLLCRSSGCVNLSANTAALSYRLDIGTIDLCFNLISLLKEHLI